MCSTISEECSCGVALTQSGTTGIGNIGDVHIVANGYRSTVNIQYKAIVVHYDGSGIAYTVLSSSTASVIGDTVIGVVSALNLSSILILSAVQGDIGTNRVCVYLTSYHLSRSHASNLTSIAAANSVEDVVTLLEVLDCLELVIIQLSRILRSQTAKTCCIGQNLNIDHALISVVVVNRTHQVGVDVNNGYIAVTIQIHLSLYTLASNCIGPRMTSSTGAVAVKQVVLPSGVAIVLIHTVCIDLQVCLGTQIVNVASANQVIQLTLGNLGVVHSQSVISIGANHIQLILPLSGRTTIGVRHAIPLQVTLEQLFAQLQGATGSIVNTGSSLLFVNGVVLSTAATTS